MAHSFTFLTFALAASACVPAAEGNALRGQQALSSAIRPMAELRLALMEPSGSPEVEEHVANLTGTLYPVFLAIPRSAEGYLDASAVRHLLHRHFHDRDGWFVQGWDGAGEEADNSLPETVLQGDSLASVFSERLVARGLSLREVAVMAMALETLASTETEQRLEFAYQFSHLAHRKDHATQSQLDHIHQVYAVTYVMGFNSKFVSVEMMRIAIDNIEEAFPRWGVFLKWFREVRDEVLSLIPEDQRFSFEGQVRIFDEMEHRYGNWLDLECQSLKSGLLQHSIPGTGRVPLRQFYTATLPGGWQAMESQEYLAEIGALDETDPDNPSVVISNYFDTPSNCMNASSYYFVCCISECDSILSALERKLASPSAPPQQILEIIEKLPSSRAMPTQLVQRLESIAEMHGGRAPLHSRLFRQWMHHAYPDECVYPALSMTLKPRTPDEFELQTGRSPFLDDGIRQRYADEQWKAARTDEGDVVLAQELPWSEEEELFITCRSDSSGLQTQPKYGSWRLGGLVLVFVSVVSMLAREWKCARFAQEVILPFYHKKACVA